MDVIAKIESALWLVSTGFLLGFGMEAGRTLYRWLTGSDRP